MKIYMKINVGSKTLIFEHEIDFGVQEFTLIEGGDEYIRKMIELIEFSDPEPDILSARKSGTKKIKVV